MAKTRSMARAQSANNFNKYARIAKSVARVAGTAYGSYRRAYTKRSSSGSTAVTQQHDFRQQYRRKAMPRYKKRRWVKFVKRVQAVDFASHASNFVVRGYKSPNIDVNPTNVANRGAQNITAVGLYGCKTEQSDATIVGDVYDIFTEWANSANNVESQKLCFTSAVSDIYVTNIGVGTMILDVYHCICKKDMPVVNGLNLFDTSIYQNFPADKTGEAALDSGQAGVSPFQLPYVTTYFKIMDKKKYIISAGQVVTWQQRDPKNRIFGGSQFDFKYAPLSAKAGLTHIWLMVATGPELCTQTKVSYTVSQTRNYTFKVLDNSQEHARYLAV